ncbi:ATP-binding cassette, subfamily C/ATP-binding cassette, subfamily C, CydD [Streptosporangium subroseum]|uniref:ATP-binding cassette, subfamily C/ATP-binding cassette, subfamily C, CydD n=1 Tax=Streptosporangium subroseum TaxID=106412 RepID=A0A239N6J7_9ACTN|nr:thiol reductant ABC exporter subunit CydD [Streptosporangium subroseum]SNT49808.1 ATP-binding cassette, subfamily C/ATP-binding cassette, subfamily C, CydD [Streptosporangium subroseum]
MHKDLVRLARSERAVRRHLALCLAAAVLAGLLILIQAELLAGVLSGRFATPALILLALVVGVRALFTLVQGIAAGHATTGVKSVLRHRLLSRLQEVGPTRPASQRSGELVTLTGRGLDALDPYLSGYLPAIAVAGVVPIAVLVRLFTADLASAVIVLVTLPLIPIFGALVGMHTKAVTERQWRALSRLGGHFLDVVRGLPTLRAFGRARFQAEVIRQVSDAHRSATMRTLRVAFLSSLVLELAASLSLALVAVPVGLRLLSGSLDLSTALLVLLLAPEAYLPLRNMGNKFHAAMEGVAAADEAFAVLDGRASPSLRDATSGANAGGTRGTDGAGANVSTAGVPGVSTGTGTTGVPNTSVAGAPDTAGVPDTGAAGAPDRGRDAGAAPEIRLENVTVRYPDREETALDDVSLVIAPGERVALVGESGAGKSTLLHLLLGFVAPASGRVLIDGVELTDHLSWRDRLAFVPQRPHLFAASVADNIRLGAPDATIEEVRAAAKAAHADEFVTTLPEGYDTVLGERGANLSAGQRQRVALARAFCRPAARLLLLDEPTARLDGRSEGAVMTATRDLAEGRTAVIVAHRPAMIDLADRVIRIADGRVVSDQPAGPRAGRAAYSGRDLTGVSTRKTEEAS